MRKRTLSAALMMVLGLLGGVAVLAQRPEAKPRKPVLRLASPPRSSTPDLPPIEASPLESPLPPATESVPPPSLGEPRVDDPMKDVDTFVAQNRKKAEDSIQRLTKEAETLRARLRQVEMALERWKSLAGALDQPLPSGLEATPGNLVPPPPTGPTEPSPTPTLPPAPGD